MHLLHTADQRGQNRGRKRKSVCARWRNSDGLPASVSHRSDHFREHQRSQQPRFEIETANAELQHAGGTQYASANDISGKDTEFESPEQLLSAAHRTREAGYRRIDAFSPMPIEGLAEAVGFYSTRLPLIVLLGGMFGA